MNSKYFFSFNLAVTLGYWLEVTAIEQDFIFLFLCKGSRPYSPGQQIFSIKAQTGTTLEFGGIQWWLFLLSFLLTTLKNSKLLLTLLQRWHFACLCTSNTSRRHLARPVHFTCIWLNDESSCSGSRSGKPKTEQMLIMDVYIPLCLFHLFVYAIYKLIIDFFTCNGHHILPLHIFTEL